MIPHAKKLAEFIAVDPEGRRVNVLVLVDAIDASTHRGPAVEYASLRRMETTEGEEVIIMDGRLAERRSYPCPFPGGWFPLRLEQWVGEPDAALMKALKL